MLSLDRLSPMPFRVQLGLLQDLMFFANGQTEVELPGKVPEYSTGLPDVLLFALVLYHRFVVRTTLNYVMEPPRIFP